MEIQYLYQFWVALEPIVRRHNGRLLVNLAFQATQELHGRRRALKEFVKNKRPTATEVPFPGPPQRPPMYLNDPPDFLSEYSEEKQTEKINQLVLDISLDMQSAEYWFLMAEGKGRVVAGELTFIHLTKSELMVEVRKWADEVEETIAGELRRALTKEEKLSFWYLEAKYWGNESRMWHNYVKEVHRYRYPREIPPLGAIGCRIQREYFNDHLGRLDRCHM